MAIGYRDWVIGLSLAGYRAIGLSYRAVAIGLSGYQIELSGYRVGVQVARASVAALPGVSSLDPLTYGSVGLLVLACAAGAGLSAAWRLRSVAPAEALRTE